MPVIFTDERGQGYDYDQLKSAYDAGQFGAGSRVGDLLAQHAPTQAAPTPSPSPSSSSPSVETPGGTGSEATTYTAPTASTVDPSQYRLMGSAPIDLNSILGFYQKYLGRTPGQDEVYFASGHPGGAQALEQFIANSPEAQAYAGRKKVAPVPAPVQTLSGAQVNPYDQSNAANYGTGGIFNIPAPGNAANEIYGFFSRFTGRAGTNKEITDYLNSGKSLGQIQNEIANGAEAQAFAAHGGSANNAANTNTPYSNSSQSLVVNAALQRLAQLQQPIDRTAEDAYTKMALDRVNQLSGAPFTDTQNAALLTQHMAPLTQARDTAKQQAAEEMSRRGIIPSSGVFQDRMKAIDQAYERGVAGVTNTLNIQGIDATQKNAALQLQILDSLVNMGRMSRQEADQRSQEIVQTAGIPFDTDLKTLGALTSASGGDNASSLISSLLSLGGLNLKGNEIATAQNGQDSAAIGQVIGYIMAHHADFGF